MNLTFVLALVLGVIAGCHGNEFKMGACPRVTVTKKLDFDKFLGEWHVIQRFRPLVTCAKLVVEKSPEGTYAVNETSLPLGFPIYYPNQYLKTRKVHFLRNDTQSIFRIEKNLVHMTLATFGVVATDYDKYAVMWGCDPILFGSMQNIDILARQPQPDEDTIATAMEAVKKIGVDYSSLNNVLQTHCAGTTEPTPKPSDEKKNTNNIVV